MTEALYCASLITSGTRIHTHIALEIALVIHPGHLQHRMNTHSCQVNSMGHLQACSVPNMGLWETPTNGGSQITSNSNATTAKVTGISLEA